MKKYITFNNSYSNFDYFQKITNYMLGYIFAGFLLMSLFQLAIIIHYGDLNFYDEASQLIQSFISGAKGSFKVFAAFILPFFLIAIGLWLLPWRKPIKLFVIGLHTICLIFLIFSFILSIANFFYYQPFQTHFNIFIFEAQNETWTDLYYYIIGEIPLGFTLILIFVGIGALFYVNRFLIYLSNFNIIVKKWYWKTTYTIFLLLLITIFVRGSFNPSVVYKFIRDAEVTNNNLLNSSATNSISALFQAFEDKENYYSLSPISDAEAIAAFKLLFPQQNANINNLQQALYTKTKQKEVERKPNVVFALMEGWGGHLLNFHDKENFNVLGALEKHSKEDFLFRNFTSHGPSTYVSLQFLLSNISELDIFDTKYSGVVNQSAITKVFKEKGYKLIFITSGKKNWYLLGDYYKSLGFDEIYGWYDLKKLYPNAPTNFYGGFEETAYKYILQKLKKQQEKDKPLFIFFLTTTSHSPYWVPKNYQPYPLNIPDDLEKILLSSKDGLPLKIITTYQYTSETLGQFVSAIKSDANLKNKTIIAGTGDHRTRSLFNYNANESEIYGSYIVPFYLYLPSEYRKGLYFDKNRISSHSDIFPTLFNLLFSNTKYFASGNNLFTLQNSNDNLAIHTEFVMTNKGTVRTDIGDPIYYKWQDKVLGKLKRIKKEAAGDLKLAYKKQQAYLTLLKWNFRQELEK